ncbi:MAG: hypothetical protein Q9214_007594, partial [Letrouitia sp. 1 TL-2023]
DGLNQNLSVFAPNIGELEDGFSFNSLGRPSTITGFTYNDADLLPDVINSIGSWDNTSQQAFNTSDYAAMPALAVENSKGSESMFDLCNIFDNWGILEAHIKNQSKGSIKTNSDSESLAKGIRCHALKQLLEAFDGAITFDQKKWISFRLAHALDDMDNLNSQDIRLIEEATERIIKFHESTESIEETARFRKITKKIDRKTILGLTYRL